MTTQPSDVEIAQAHPLKPITEIAATAGIPDAALIPYGTTKAKVDITALECVEPAEGKIVLVTGVSPTPAGEGKSTVLIGLADAFSQLGERTVVALREPSQGPVMGIKGGAAGGGYSQIVPMEDINLHFTGDFHAISAATNTLAAIIDNHIHQGNELNIDPRKVTWQRCIDVNDRALRHVVTGLGGPTHGVPAETGFTITAASEIMAILCLATSLKDLKKRLGDITVGFTYDGELLREGSHPRCEVTDELLSLIDVLVDGRFVLAQKDISLRFRGSRNQRILDLPKTRAQGKIVLWQEPKREI